jgi:hypothetical protein
MRVKTVPSQSTVVGGGNQGPGGCAPPAINEDGTSATEKQRWRHLLALIDDAKRNNRPQGVEQVYFSIRIATFKNREGQKVALLQGIQTTGRRTWIRHPRNAILVIRWELMWFWLWLVAWLRCALAAMWMKIAALWSWTTPSSSAPKVHNKFIAESPRRFDKKAIALASVSCQKARGEGNVPHCCC